jgi:DNA-directed RNA polymerase-3 subunit RPC5
MYCSIVRISNVDKSDEGTYEVSAKNREGESTNTLILNVTSKKVVEVVNEPPIIVKQLTPTVCKLGDAVKLEAVITGKPTPKIEWSHNGATLQSGGNAKMTEKDNIYTLVIEKVDQNCDGDYSVLAVNSSGSVQTSANLTVQGEAIEFVQKLDDIEIKEKKTVEMNVEVSAEETNVKWYKDGEAISKTDEKYEFKTAGRKHSLVIKNATAHVEGEYSAVVGEQECSMELTVVELPPEFTKRIQPLTVTAGEQKIVFDTEISKGDAVTKWYKSGTEIKESTRFQMKIDGKCQRLEIFNVELADAGEYMCTIGNEKCTAQLTVEEPKVTFVEKLQVNLQYCYCYCYCYCYFYCYCYCYCYCYHHHYVLLFLLFHTGYNIWSNQ